VALINIVLVVTDELWPNDFRFNKIGKNLSRYIAIKISQPNDLNGWREIGEELEVDEINLDAINIEGDEKGKKLFDVLGGINPKLKLNKFVSVLAKLGRNEIVEEIEKQFKYSSENTTILNDEENENVK
jgi:hypothetical protein